MWRFLALFIVMSSLSGCANNNIIKYGEIDKGEKTGLLPPGSRGILGSLKSALVSHGWSLIVSQGGDKFIGKVTPDVNVIRSGERTTRYTFIVNQEVWNVCAIGDNAVKYEVILVDNKTGEEVANISGRGDCLVQRNDKMIAEAVGNI